MTSIVSGVTDDSPVDETIRPKVVLFKYQKPLLSLEKTHTLENTLSKFIH